MTVILPHSRKVVFPRLEDARERERLRLEAERLIRDEQRRRLAAARKKDKAQR